MLVYSNFHFVLMLNTSAIVDLDNFEPNMNDICCRFLTYNSCFDWHLKYFYFRLFLMILTNYFSGSFRSTTVIFRFIFIVCNDHVRIISLIRGVIVKPMIHVNHRSIICQSKDNDYSVSYNLSQLVIT